MLLRALIVTPTRAFYTTSRRTCSSRPANLTTGTTSLERVTASRPLGRSIDAFCYAILGAQARTRVSIVNNVAANDQTQDVFWKLVEDTVVQVSVTISISNMRKTINDCNITVNTAVSRNLWLFPSDLVIIKKKIAGYNVLGGLG